MSHHDNDDCPHLVPMRLLEAENARLKAENARLRKAGDAMVPLLGRGDYHDARINWNAAKEGKPSV